MQRTLKRLQFRDAHLFCTTFGSVRDRALLLLHGAFLSGLSWQPLIQSLLAQNYYVIVPDLRGHGASGTLTRDWTFMDFAEDMYLALAHLGVEQAAVIGHSLGAMIALCLAARYRWQVLGVALLEPLWPSRGFMSALFRHLPISLKVRQIEAWHGLQPYGTDGEIQATIRQNLDRKAQWKPEWQAIWTLLRHFDGLTIAPHVRVPSAIITNDYRFRSGSSEERFVNAIGHPERRIVHIRKQPGSMISWPSTQEALTGYIGSFCRETKPVE